MWRSYTMLKTDPSMTITMLVSNFIEALVVSSIFYNLPQTTNTFNKRAILMFFIILINAFGSILEIMTLYAKRNIIEKHARYALYHPSAEALASMIVDLPYKLLNAIIINVTLYFMTNLRREAGPFFFFLLISFTTTLVMSMLFRLIGSTTKSIAQALAPASIILLALVLYTGYAIPPQYMKGWIGWCRWGNPIFYSLESALLNEFVGRDFACSTFVPSGPGYDDVSATGRACSALGSVAGRDRVDGAAYLATAFKYDESHKWRNFGILVAFMIGYLLLHLLATEYVASQRSKGEVLVFSRKSMNKRQQKGVKDVESGTVTAVTDSTDDNTSDPLVEKQTSIFHWKNVCYDVTIKGEPRRILDNLDGWVKPGTLTALMVSKQTCDG
jgi:ABC-type multidrug transport system permease subunit